MKTRRILLLLLALIVFTSPVWALFCTACGSRLPDDAKFCAQCGKARAGGSAPIVTQTSEPAPIATPAPAPAPAPPPAAPSAPAPTLFSNPGAGQLVPPAPPVTAAPTISVRFSDDLLKRYDEINRFEAYLLSSTYYRSMSRTNEFRLRIREDLGQADFLARRGSPLEAKLHNLYKRKFELLEKYQSAWGEATLGPLKGQGEARKAQAAFLLERINDLILTLRETPMGQEAQVLSQVEQTERQLDLATREYRVTSQYLKIGDTVVSMSHPLWVLEIQGNQAKVMSLAQSCGPDPLWGWVSLYDLARRTTWREEYRTTVFVPLPQPPSPPSTVIIIVDDTHCWPRRRPYPIIFRFPFPGRGHDHDRGPGPDRGPGRGDSHGRKDDHGPRDKDPRGRR